MGLLEYCSRARLFNIFVDWISNLINADTLIAVIG